LREPQRPDDPPIPDRKPFRSTIASDDIRIFLPKPTAITRTGGPPEEIPDQRCDTAEQFRNAGSQKPPPDG
jgi:hypothetical protein